MSEEKEKKYSNGHSVSYCSNCGRQLEEIEVTAGGQRKLSLFSSDTIFRDFDTSTGKQQYVRVVTCPRKGWFWPHNSYLLSDKPYTK